MTAEIHFNFNQNGPYFDGEFPIYTWEVTVFSIAVLALIVWLVIRARK